MPVLKPGDKGPQSWPCPVCNRDNTGNIQDGCQHCGAGTAQPYKKDRAGKNVGYELDPDMPSAEEDTEQLPLEAFGLGVDPDVLREASQAGAMPAPGPVALQQYTPTPVQQDVFSLKHGSVTFSWPTKMSEGELDGVEAWLKVVLKKIKQQVEVHQ